MSQYLKVIAWNKNIIVSIHPSIHHSISQFKELWNVARFLWNLADISMLKRLIRARLSQTQQKIEITRSAIYCYSTEIFRFHRVLYCTWYIQTSKSSSVTCRSPPCWRRIRAAIWARSDILWNKQGEHRTKFKHSREWGIVFCVIWNVLEPERSNNFLNKSFDCFRIKSERTCMDNPILFDSRSRRIEHPIKRIMYTTGIKSNGIE